MNFITKSLKIQKENGTVCNYKVSFEELYGTSISLLLDDGTEKKFNDCDLFESLKLINTYFENELSKLLCNGARVDVCSSGMSRSIGNGRKVYITVLGKQARRNDLVDIFDFAKPNEVGTVQEQENYHKKWISSLG